MRHTYIYLSLCATLLTNAGCGAEYDTESNQDTTTGSGEYDEVAQELVDGATCQEFWDGNNFETNADLPPNVIVTGVGARANSSEDITAIRLQGRNSDSRGVLGTPAPFNFGSAPQVTPEVWCPVPSGHLAIGIAASANNNHAVSQIIVFSRQYNQATRSLVGEVLPNRCGPEKNVPPERQVVAWEHTADFDGVVDNVVLTGVSMGMRGSAINGLRARFCRLK